MNISVKEFTPKYTDGKLEKKEIMRNANNNFRTISNDNILQDDRLDSLASILQRNLVYSNLTWKDNHRLSKNALLDKIDFLILDIDDGITLDEVHEMVPFKIMTVTTTSHTSEHHKFRVIIPLLKVMSFQDKEEYKVFMKVLNDTYFQSKADSACFDVARVYITTDKANTKINQAIEYFDPKDILEKAQVEIVSELWRYKGCSTSINTRGVDIDTVLKYKKVKEHALTFRSGNHYNRVYSIIGIAKIAGLSNEDCAELILTYNLPAEYGNKEDLIKKASKYDYSSSQSSVQKMTSLADKKPHHSLVD